VLLQLACILGMPPKFFEAFGIHAWPAILHKIEPTLIIKTSSNTHFNEWRENFKDLQHRVYYKTAWIFSYLTSLLDAQEQSWFVT
jgi:hypothetical protein